MTFPTPDDPNRQPRLNEIIRNLNAQDPSANGYTPILPPSVRPRPSGWRCPKCGQDAHQRVVPAPGTVTGYRWRVMSDTQVPGLSEQPLTLFPDDQRPEPVAVVAPEVTERDTDGSPIKTYVTLHCLNCFNIWQRRKMMEDLRANVPQLVYEGGSDA